MTSLTGIQPSSIFLSHFLPYPSSSLPYFYVQVCVFDFVGVFVCVCVCVVSVYVWCTYICFCVCVPVRMSVCKYAYVKSFSSCIVYPYSMGRFKSDLHFNNIQWSGFFVSQSSCFLLILLFLWTFFNSSFSNTSASTSTVSDSVIALELSDPMVWGRVRS